MTLILVDILLKTTIVDQVSYMTVFYILKIHVTSQFIKLLKHVSIKC